MQNTCTVCGGSLEGQKVVLPDRESNPGLPRDRRRSSPLDYRGFIDGEEEIVGQNFPPLPKKHDFRKALSKAHFSMDETCSCLTLCILFQLSLSTILDSLVVRISACHVEGPGSIPGRGVHSFATQALFAVGLHISDRTSSCMPTV